MDINSPFTLTLTHHDLSVSFTVNHSDIEISTVFELFKCALLSIGYQESSIKDEILNQGIAIKL